MNFNYRKMSIATQRIIAVVSCAVLQACATNAYQEFYRPSVDAKTLPDVQLLGPGEEPKIFSSNDLQRDVDNAISRNYRVIGTSSFNGSIESERALVNQAKSVGAVLVLTNAKFTDSRAITTPFFLPNNQTTYGSGTVFGPYGYAKYSGTSTTYGSTVIPITSQQQRYDQTAVYFVKSTKKPKFGFSYEGLTPELRARYERNTGILVGTVSEDSPAFLANILPGDILIELNGKPLGSMNQSEELLKSIESPDGKYVFKVIRNGMEKIIELHH